MSNTTTNSPSPYTPSQQQLQDILNQHQQQIQTLSAELRTRPDFTHLVRLMSQEQASLISSITSKQTPFQVPVPEFCGSSPATQWFSDLDRLFHLYGCDDATKLRYARYGLRNLAAELFSTQEFPSYVDFQTAVLDRFRPSTHQFKGRVHLLHMSCTETTISSYISDFTHLSTSLAMSDGEKSFWFLHGLPVSINSHVYNKMESGSLKDFEQIRSYVIKHYAGSSQYMTTHNSVTDSISTPLNMSSSSHIHSPFSLPSATQLNSFTSTPHSSRSHRPSDRSHRSFKPHRSPSSSPASRSSKSSSHSSSSSKSSSRTNSNCYFCKRPGHFWEKCPSISPALADKIYRALDEGNSLFSVLKRYSKRYPSSNYKRTPSYGRDGGKLNGWW